VAKTEAEMDKPVAYIVYLNPVGTNFDMKNPDNIFTISRHKSIAFKPNTRKLQKKYEIRVSAVDRLHNESEPTQMKVIKM
jgi:hypothetical protein